MRRRQFLALAISATIWPPAMARAQRSSVPTIGFLSTEGFDDSASVLTGITQGLARSGFVEGENLSVMYRWAEDQDDLLPGSVLI